MREFTESSMAYLSREPPPPEPLARRAGAAPDTGGRAKGSGINAWLERACRRDRLKLQPDAQLAPLVTALPPADMRLPLTFRPLDEASLRGFELRPVIKRPEQAAAGSADGAAGTASLAGTASSSGALVYAGASSPTARAEVATFTSTDEAQSWGGKRVVWPGPAGYVDAVALGEGGLGLLYEAGEKTFADRIQLTVAPRAWLLRP